MKDSKNPFHSLLVAHCSLLSGLSGLLLAFSFPNFNLGFLAWIALVPLLMAIQRCEKRSQAFRAGLLAGLVFFLISIHWLTNVTAFGWLFMATLESLFIGLFALSIHYALTLALSQRERGMKRTSHLPLSLAGEGWGEGIFRATFIALSWTSFEFIRSEFPIFGFGWNLLAYSQSDYLWILQSANTVGAYGLGFIIAFVNACLVLLVTQSTENRVRRTESIAVICILFSVILVLLTAHGIYHLKVQNTPAGTLRISLIQGNIPQTIKWEAEARDKIMTIYEGLTRLSHFDQPDLVIWPEAAFPGYFNRDRDAYRIKNLVREAGIPLLVGAPHFFAPDNAYNSAYLLDANGEVRARYDKQYLVPFGEYVPLKPIFGWLERYAYALGVSDFSAGRDFRVFEIQNGEFKFSALICFEDIFPDLARRFVKKGADFLAVITNDAWFGETSAPYQHLQASIFRAVENGVPVVRAANTGVSAFISRKGEVLDRVKDKGGKEIFITGKQTFELPMDVRKTNFRRGGWIFPYITLGLFVIILAMKSKVKNQKAKERKK